MIRDIIKYPTPPSASFSAPVRVVNDEILTLIQDMKDTIEANSMEALAAFQIGSPYNIVVVKQGDSYLELLNPLIVMMDGEQRVKETTAYFPGLSAMVNRSDKISVVYDDIDLKSQTLRAEGEFSALLQRKIDYTFGSSFLNKLDPEEKALFESKLEGGSDIAQISTCPTSYNRDYIAKFSNILLISMVLLLIGSFFTSDDMADSMFSYQTYLAVGVVLSNIVYFFYAQYEEKKNSACSSCQIGNIVGTVAIALTRVSALMLLSYFIIL